MKRKKFHPRQQQAMQEIMEKQLASMLHDVTYRMQSLRDAEERNGRVGSNELNVPFHLLDGFVVTSNTTDHRLYWTDCSMAYKGQVYVIDNSSTPDKYIWWDFSLSTTTFQTTNIKPILEDDDVMVFIKNGDAHQVVVGTGRMIDGSIVKDGTIGESEVGADAIKETHLQTDAVTYNKIKNGAVIQGKLADNAVIETNLVDGSVTNGKVGSGAVSAAKMNIAQHILF